MSGFTSNLLAEAIGLVAGLLLTYVIIDKLLKRQEKRTWEPARQRLLSAVKRQCEGAFIGWANKAKEIRGKALDMANLSQDTLRSVVADLETEITNLRAIEEIKLFESRTPEYWLGQLRNLSSLKESLRLAIDRLQLTLRNEPDLVELIADLEARYMPIPGHEGQLRLLQGLDDDDDGMGRISREVANRLLAASPVMTIAVYEQMLKVWHTLAATPGGRLAE